MNKDYKGPLAICLIMSSLLFETNIQMSLKPQIVVITHRTMKELYQW